MLVCISFDARLYLFLFSSVSLLMLVCISFCTRLYLLLMLVCVTLFVLVCTFFRCSYVSLFRYSSVFPSKTIVYATLSFCQTYFSPNHFHVNIFENLVLAPLPRYKLSPFNSKYSL